MNLKINYIKIYKDLTIREFILLTNIIILLFLFGLYPNYLLKSLHTSIIFYLNYSN